MGPGPSPRAARIARIGTPGCGPSTPPVPRSEVWRQVARGRRRYGAAEIAAAKREAKLFPPNKDLRPDLALRGRSTTDVGHIAPRVLPVKSQEVVHQR